MDEKLLGDLHEVARMYLRDQNLESVRDLLNEGSVKLAQAFMHGMFTAQLESLEITTAEAQKRISALQMSDEDRISLLREERIKPGEKVGLQ